MTGILDTFEGQELLKGDETVPFQTIKESGKFIGLYFSAHWCPPCRGFTPLLADLYNTNTDKLEIIFLSCDRDDKAFLEYFKSMPWCALGFDEAETRHAVSNKASVTGIPHFMLLNPDGSVLHANARQLVTGKAGEFPWNN